MAITRRNLVHMLGGIGGAGLAYSSMVALGLAPAAEASPLPRLPRSHGSGTRVAVLGGGIAGLVAAYELKRAGYSVTLLEARDRPGGRNWSIRRGSRIDLTDGSQSVCGWGEGDYLNAGCARISHLHHNILGYCHALGVALEVEVNTSGSARIYSPDLNGGVPVERRQVDNDSRGYVSELLAKAIHRGSLDDVLTKADAERLVECLRGYGDLDEEGAFKGTYRSGYSRPAGTGPERPVKRAPLALRELLKIDFSENVYHDENLPYQATMFQPVGGIDRIAYALAAALGSSIRYQAAVQEIRRSPKGVAIRYAAPGGMRMLEADYCISTLPPNLLARLPSDIDARRRKALSSSTVNTTAKIGWRAPRFWEKNEHIYGGISFLHGEPVDMVWYPSDRLGSEWGILLSGMVPESDDGKPTEFGALSTAGKLAASRRAVERLHPGHGASLTQPTYVPWARIPFSEGALFAFPDEDYRTLSQDDDRLFYAGDWLSRSNGWQEGAVLSAHRVVAALAARVAAG